MPIKAAFYIGGADLTQGTGRFFERAPLPEIFGSNLIDAGRGVGGEKYVDGRADAGFDFRHRQFIDHAEQQGLEGSSLTKLEELPGGAVDVDDFQPTLVGHATHVSR